MIERIILKMFIPMTLSKKRGKIVTMKNGFKKALDDLPSAVFFLGRACLFRDQALPAKN
jgi:hypothetical protein